MADSNSDYIKDHLQAEVSQLQRELTELKDKMARMDHQKKKEILEMRTELQFERRKAAEFQQKFKNEIKSKETSNNLKSISTELTSQIAAKENEIQELKKQLLERKRKVNELESELEIARSTMIHRTPSKNSEDESELSRHKALQQQNENLKQDMLRIQEGAVSAIMEKENIIMELQDKLRIFEESLGMHAAEELLELKERYGELEERYEKQSRQHEEAVYYKDMEINDYKERMETMKARNEERIAALQQDMTDYENYIQRLKEEKTQEDTLAESIDILQEKNRKYEKRVHELEQALNEEKVNQEDESKRVEFEIQGLKTKIQTLKVYETNFHALEKQIEKERRAKEKEISQLNQNIEKLTENKSDSMKKMVAIEAERKRLVESIDQYKRHNNEILAERERLMETVAELKENFRLKLQEQREREQREQEENMETTVTTNSTNQDLSTPVKRDTLEEELSKAEHVSSSRVQLEESLLLTDKLKKQIAEYEEHIKQLNEEISKKVAETQGLRTKIIQLTELSQNLRDDDEKKNLRVEVETLKSHVQKFENNLLIIKLKNAEDENFWKERQKADRLEFSRKEQQFLKEKAQLYEKFEKLRKGKGQVKADYYQTSLK